MSQTRRDLSLAEKCALLKKYDDLGLASLSQAVAAQKLEISQPLLCQMLKNRYEIKTSLFSNDSSTRK